MTTLEVCVPPGQGDLKCSAHQPNVNLKFTTFTYFSSAISNRALLVGPAVGRVVELIPRDVGSGRGSRDTGHFAVDLLDHGSDVTYRDRCWVPVEGDT